MAPRSSKSPASSSKAPVKSPFVLKKKPDNAICKTGKKSNDKGYLEPFVHRYQRDSEHGTAGEIFKGMSVNYRSAYEDRFELTRRVNQEVKLGDGEKEVWKPESRYFRLKMTCPVQGTKLNTILNELPNTEVPEFDWMEEFNVRALARLNTDVFPHPTEPNYHAAMGEALYNIKVKVQEECPIFKYENLNGNKVFAFPTAQLAGVLSVLRYWGYRVTQHDSVDFQVEPDEEM